MPRGGLRLNSGRKKAYGEKTKAMRLPESIIPMVQEILNRRQSEDAPTLSFGESIASLISLKKERIQISSPLYTNTVSAGFPSPAADDIEVALDLNEHLIQHPAATFFVRASGTSMINAGIHSGDILIVDRSISPKNNAIVIAVLNGELTVKRLVHRGKGICLKAENPDHPNIDVLESMEFSIWGTVTTVIHQV